MVCPNLVLLSQVDLSALMTSSELSFVEERECNDKFRPTEMIIIDCNMHFEAIGREKTPQVRVRIPFFERLAMFPVFKRYVENITIPHGGRNGLTSRLKGVSGKAFFQLNFFSGLCPQTDDRGTCGLSLVGVPTQTPPGSTTDRVVWGQGLKGLAGAAPQTPCWRRCPHHSQRIWLARKSVSSCRS